VNNRLLGSKVVFLLFGKWLLYLMRLNSSKAMVRALASIAIPETFFNQWLKIYLLDASWY
jgi:hypothetical protein